MTDRRSFLASTASLALAQIAGLRAAHGQAKRITIGTNPAGTFYYVLGGGLAKLFVEKLGARAVAQPYAGSSVYLPMINDGEVTMGLSSTLDSGGAYRGDQGRTPNRKLRSLARMWPLRYAMVVRRDSPIRTAADLRGKRVVMSFKANVSLAPIHHAVLASVGMTAADITPVDVAGIPQGIRAVVDGSADATWAAVGIPATREAHASVGIRYVDFAGPNFTQDFLNARVPGLFPMSLAPSPTLPEVTESVQITGFDVFIVVSADMPAAQARQIIEVIYDAYPGLQQTYPALRLGAQKELARATNTVPFHPGAVPFFKAKGLWTPQNDAQEKRITST
jgi:TRAP transporter TAXI family solute receptor